MDVLALGYIGFETSDVAAWAEYGPAVLGFGVAKRSDGDNTYLRMDDRAFRIAMHSGDRDRLAYLGWELQHRPAFEAAVDHLRVTGVKVHVGDDELADRRAVHAVAAFEDPFGYRHEIFYGHQTHPHSFLPGRPHGGFVAGGLGLGHVVLAVPEVTSELRRFASESMNFLWAGQGSRKFSAFYRPNRNPRSHALAYAAVPGHIGVHHMGIEVRELDDVGIAYDLVQDRDLRIQVTLGRHTQDPVISFYHFSPSGLVLEYFTGGELIDDDTYAEPRPEHLSLWGHKTLVPGLPETVQPLSD